MSGARFLSGPPAPFPRRYIIAKSKIVDDLLNPDHTRGGTKARFFMRFGFSPERPDELADALAEHIKAPDTAPTDPAKAGSVKIVFEGPIPSPDGRSPHVRTVWNVGSDGTARFVTAFPRKGSWT